MTPANNLEQALPNTDYRQKILAELGELALRHHDYAYNVRTQHPVVQQQDTYYEFYIKKMDLITKMNNLLPELIELDQLVRQSNPKEYFANANIPWELGFYDECTMLNAWLAASSLSVKYENYIKIYHILEKMIKAFASFELRYTTEEKFILSPSSNNPLVLTLLHSTKMYAVPELLIANAPLYEGMLQFAINKQDIDLLNLFLNKSQRPLANLLIAILEFNLNVQNPFLTLEIARVIASFLTRANNRLKLHVTPENFARVNPDIIRELLPHIDCTLVRKCLIYAAKNNLPNFAETLLQHPALGIHDLQEKYDQETPLIVALPNKEVHNILLNKHIELFLRVCKGSELYDIDDSAGWYIVTQDQIAAYFVNKAQNLPQTPQSIAQIRTDIEEITGDTNLRRFLRGTVIGRLRNKLIADLETEITKIQNTIQRGNDEGTSSPVNYQAPIATGSSVKKSTDNLDVELSELDTSKKKTNNFDN